MSPKDKQRLRDAWRKAIDQSGAGANEQMTAHMTRGMEENFWAKAQISPVDGKVEWIAIDAPNSGQPYTWRMSIEDALKLEATYDNLDARIEFGLIFEEYLQRVESTRLGGENLPAPDKTKPDLPRRNNGGLSPR